MSVVRGEKEKHELVKSWGMDGIYSVEMTQILNWIWWKLNYKKKKNSERNCVEE